MNSPAETTYDAAAIEARRQRAWRDAASFRAPAASERRRGVYIKASSPFTSGNIHVGHVRSYSLADAYARFRRARGDAVLFSIGFDAFGLPAEQAAIRNGEPTQRWVERSSAKMAAQLERLGFSFDWERTFMTSDVDVYRWSQWLFLRLLDAGLIQREVGGVDWCSNCQTSLASMQVEDGRCWRCHEPTKIVQRPQWYLRLSGYVEENERALERLTAWSGVALHAQRGLLGRTSGVELEVVATDGRTLTVFTPHREQLGDARFVMLSPRHPDVARWLTDDRTRALAQELRSVGWQRTARSAASAPLIDTGHTVDLPGFRRNLPVIVSPAVDSRYGATAILGVPSADNTDATVAERLELTSDEHPADPGARPVVREAVRYRTHDFSIARQRSWGTPIPIVHCPECGIVPLRIEELPVELPPHVRHAGVDGQSAEAPTELPTAQCWRCGAEATRETDTLDGHFEGLWIWIPACVPRSARAEAMFDDPDLERWLPGGCHVFGSDCSTYTFDQRILAKALRDMDVLPHLRDGEPFDDAIMHGMVTLAGRKMSKHLGNAIDPDELVSRYGADTVRLAMLYAARPNRAITWTEQPVEQCNRFVTELWKYAYPRLVENSSRFEHAGTSVAVGSNGSAQRRRLARRCATAIEQTTGQIERSEMHLAVRGVMRLFDGIREFETRASSRHELYLADEIAIASALIVLAQLLSPFAPHVGEELWLASGRGEPERPVPWPSLDAWAELGLEAVDGEGRRGRLTQGRGDAQAATTSA